MALLHPLIFARSKVLACKGGDGDAHGVHDHPEQSVHLAVNGPGRNDVGAEAVDVGLDHHVGNGVEHRLESCRKADLDDLSQHGLIHLQMLQFKPEGFLRAHQRPHHQGGGKELGQDRRQSGSRHLHFQYHNEQQVQSDVHKTTDDQIIQRTLGVSHGP